MLFRVYAGVIFLHNKSCYHVCNLFKAVAFFCGVLVKPSEVQDKITCKPGDVLIGNFEGNSYTFSCCAGAQCGGCRKNKKGECLECAAGYVHQVLLNPAYFSYRSIFFGGLSSRQASNFLFKAHTDFERHRPPILLNMYVCIFERKLGSDLPSYAWLE